MAETILFYALAGILLFSAGLVVTVRNIFHAALYLALALFAVAALYVMLGAYFLAAIQVLIYIGAVVVLAIFVINLTRTVTGAPVTLTRRWVIPAALVSALTASLIVVALLRSAGAGGSAAANAADTAAANAADTAAANATDAVAGLGRHLLGDFVLPFELVSVLLLSALIAAIVIVGKDREDEK
ncbi:MAG: NADH-quinone oxidoreductase subunit J [Spirochaetia bacterium]|jgi:NADH-quinone oxidoreductase subunit J